MSAIEDMLKGLKTTTSRFSFEQLLGLGGSGVDIPSDPQSAIAWMNAKHFVVSDSGKTVVMTEETDPILERRVLRSSSFQDLKNRYSNRWLNTVDADRNPKRVRLGHFWLDSPARRQYEGVVCAPDRCAPDYYNLWKGFSVKAVEGDWSLMDRHIKDNICSGNDEHHRYVRKWMAYGIQRPADLPEVALVLRQAGNRQGRVCPGIWDPLWPTLYLPLTEEASRRQFQRAPPRCDCSVRRRGIFR
jgi:hypothetical protein